MQYTTLGKTGLNVSRLGFGCMRFLLDQDGRVDRDLAIPLLHRAVELGVNYFDTAVFYCHGDSQRVLGEAFEKMRDRVVLSTKNHMHEADADVWWSRLEESLTNLRTDYIDVYNLHGMTWETWQKLIDGPNGKYKLLQKAKDQGLIRHICCSFHDSAQGLINLLDTGAFESITLQYNLLNRELEDAITHAKELNTGIVVMGPVGGGRLGVQSERINALTGGEAQTTPEAALRFVLAHPGVHVALSGMSDMAMLEQNVDIVSSKPPFTDAQIKVIDDEVKSVKSKMGVNCPACGYCKSCPSGVDIPGNFAVYNEYRIYGLKEHASNAYAGLVERAALCTECGACLSKCPQKIDIPTVLRSVMAELDSTIDGFGALLSITGANDDGTLRGMVTVKNIGHDPIYPLVDIAFTDGARSEPPQIRLESINPRASVTREVTILVPDGVGILKGAISVASDDQVRMTTVHQPFLLAPRDHVRWHAPIITAAHFSGRQDVVDTHGYRVGLRHDDEKLYVELDIRSKLYSLGRPGEAGGGRMELYVDMRPAEHGGRKPPYTDGAEQLFISLGAAGHGTKSNRIYTLNQVNTPKDDGVYITFELPFAEFSKPGWQRPSRIGLDFMFAVADTNGIEIGYPTYGGRGGLWQNPGVFTLAYLL